MNLSLSVSKFRVVALYYSQGGVAWVTPVGQKVTLLHFHTVNGKGHQMTLRVDAEINLACSDVVSHRMQRKISKVVTIYAVNAVSIGAIQKSALRVAFAHRFSP